MGYTISVEAEVAESPSEEAIDGLMDELQPFSGIVSGGPEHLRWGATFSLDDPQDPGQAAVDGVRVVLAAAERAGMPAAEMVLLEVMTYEEQDRLDAAAAAIGTG